MKMIRYVVVGLLCVAASAAVASSPPVFSTVYEVEKWGQFNFSSRRADNGELAIELMFTPQSIVGELFGGANEIKVRALWDNGQILSKSLEHKGEKNVTKYVFSNDRLSVAVEYEGRKYTLPLASERVLDLLSMHIQLSEDAANGISVLFYDAVSKGKLRRYVFFNKGVETIQTKIGELKTVRFDGFRKGKLRYRYWLSQAHGHLIVKAKFIRDDKVRYEVNAVSISR